MVELIDNVTQLLIMTLAAVFAGIYYYKSRIQAYFLLACFLGTYSIGTLHWTLHLLLFRNTPQIFYVSDLAWLASYMFLMTMEFTMSTSDEKKFRHPAMWLAPIFCIPQMILYLTYGDILLNLLTCGITMLTACYSIRGLIYARKQKGKLRRMQYFHTAVLCVIILEYGLWTSSCFWVSDTLTNPYFWIDFLLTLANFSLLPSMRKAVEP